MQNTPQTFRGTAAPGVNFSDHTYDNHIGVHCQPSGYQPYANSPYHPIPSPRPHHYGNHQMQQSLPYRHHGGAYAPNQNQYGAGMNQEIYRNHHSSYVGANTRNMPTKPWADSNSSSDLMPPYGQVTNHPQLMNNPPQMPVTAMRSPPHATSNMNPTPSQGQQHFRQMQSPAHSPHSWSQAQIPSPSMMHSSRTTPSPLPAHVRSPGHSQPFSPPAAHAMNLQPHPPPPPENGQIPQAMNSASSNENHNPSNPLHSLQKMVMLDQDPKSNMMSMTGDGSEQFSNQCGSHGYVPEEGTSNESKDSSYSTYYNMDENRFESKPNNSGNDGSVYSAVQQVSNCNFPVPSHPINNEADVKNIPMVGNNNAGVSDIFHPDSNSLAPPGNSSSTLEQNKCKSNIPQSDCSVKLNECPPHAESAPVFTDQTKAAVSTNSEQALESSLNSNWVPEMMSDNSDKTHLAHTPNADTAGTPNSSVSEERSICFQHSEVSNSISNMQIKSESETVSILNESNSQCNSNSLTSNECSQISDNVSCNSSESPSNDNENFTMNSEIKKDCKFGNSDCIEDSEENPSSFNITSDIQKSDSEAKSSDSKPISPFKEEDSQENCSKKPMLRRRKVGASYEEAPSPENEHKSNLRLENRSPKKLRDAKGDTKKSPSKSSNEKIEFKPGKELSRNPVKVVIHRIRKSDTDDTWHVPGNNKGTSYGENENGSSGKKSDSKSPNIGPQIIILSPAMSQKKFGYRNSVASSANSVVSVKESKTVVETVEENETNDASPNKKEGKNSPNKNPSAPNSDRKRGRPMGSKNKLKPGAVKKKRGRKGNKKKKLELSKPKLSDVVSKAKKVKNFSGPYVHITGSKDNPSSISVVNVAQKEEEKLSKTQTKRNFSSTVSKIKKKQVGHLSTLSPTYDAFNRDKTWLCIFCHKGSHHGGLGDLYGPYYIKDKAADSDGKSAANSGSPAASCSRNKRRKSDHDDNKVSKRARQSSGHLSSAHSTSVGSRSQSEISENSDSSDCLKEVWIHEDCAVWCQSISLIGEEVRGLEEAVNEASENICCHCSLDGATVGCWGKSCKQQYHFSCAKENGCQMDIENFSLLCPEHQKKSRST